MTLLLPARGITVKFPWSALILGGHKALEIRAQHTPCRERVILHCGRGVEGAHMDLLRGTRPDLYRWVTAPGSALYRRWSGITCPDDLLGRALGAVTVADCRPATDDDEQAAIVRPGAVYQAPWALVLADPRALPVPVLLTGQLGVWSLGGQAAGLAAAIRGALAGRSVTVPSSPACAG